MPQQPASAGMRVLLPRVSALITDGSADCPTPVQNMSGLASGNGRRSVGWCEEEVNAWIVAKIKGQIWVPGPLPKFPTIIRKAEVVRRVGLSHVRIWQLERESWFPRRFPLTDRVAETADAAD